MRKKETVIDFYKERYFGEIVNVTFTFLRKNFRTFGLSLLFLAGPFLLISVGFFSRVSFDDFFEYQSEAINYTHLLWGGLGAGLLSFSVFGVTYIYLVLYRKSVDKKIEVSAVFRAVRKQIVPLLGTTLGLLVLYLLISGFFIGILFFFIEGGGSTSVFVNLVLALIFIGFIVFVVYVSIPLMLLWIVRLEEGLGFIEGIKRCFTLVKNNWWATFAVIFFGSMIQSIISYIVTIPFMLSQYINSLSGSNVEISNAGLWSFLYLLVTALSSVIPTLCTGFQYYNLVEKKENRSLMDRVNTLGDQSI